MIIGVTGGVGSGKSTFAKFLEALGCAVIHADQLGREIVDSNEHIQSNLREAFGDSIFDNQNCLKRHALGRLVFSSPESLNKLNELLQKPLLKKIQLLIQQYKNKNEKHTILDMATLFETHADQFCDEVAVVTAPHHKKVQWLVRSRGWSEQEALDRMNSQMTDEERVKHPCILIENDSTVQSLQQKAKKFLNKIQSK